MADDQYKLRSAIYDFQSARQKAGIQEILARMRGKSNSLLSYEEVAEKLKLHVRTERGVQQIPVDAIVGSVGRYTDFTRTFLPRHDEDRERWSRIKAASMEYGAELPPIEVYKVGDVYFVADGHHRVSIAKQEKLPFIEARVVEFKTDISLTTNVQPDDLIIKAEYAEFLDVTRITDLRPNVDLSVTVCCQYEKILEQIRVRQHLLQQDHEEKIPFQDAILDWYDNAYAPLVEAIRDRGLLRWFPNRTLTDFYLWICENQAELEKETGWTISLETVATALSLKESSAAARQETSTGGWRKSRLMERYTQNLFNDILVPISGDLAGWQPLDQAIIIARREGAKLHGLHVVESKEKLTSKFAIQVQEKFDNICAQAEVSGTLFIEEGDIAGKICARANLADLVILKVVNPPIGGIFSLNSPFRAIINGSSRPILGLPGNATSLDRALVAYDGSPKSKEALFVGAYLAEQWKTNLTVFTALEDNLSPTAQDFARRYLEFHEVEAVYVLENSMQALKKMIVGSDFTLLLMGSYSGSVFREVFIGNTLDIALREYQVPIFICR